MAIFQQTLEKLQHFTLLATTTITATGNQTGVDLLEYDGDIQIILSGTAAGAGADLKSGSRARWKGSPAELGLQPGRRSAHNPG